eukprot:Seg7133.1 transcript_id=Seg7133.1/GoldUCD/mRNA.D3Y31 product="Telomeric repeat-binding factor 2-interacting protein 1" protein_id=Seg7133.1/GoldUCD/D3Y31
MDINYGGRTEYSSWEDEAIIDFVKKHATDKGAGTIGGNKLYKQMEEQKVTQHSWQSMKDRFLKHLHTTGPKFAHTSLITTTTRGKELPMLQHQQQGQVENKRQQPFTRERNVATVNETLIKYLKSSAGIKEIRRIKLSRRFKEFMISSKLNHIEALRVLKSVGGNFSDAVKLVERSSQKERRMKKNQNIQLQE